MPNNATATGWNYNKKKHYTCSTLAYFQERNNTLTNPNTWRTLETETEIEIKIEIVNGNLNRSGLSARQQQIQLNKQKYASQKNTINIQVHIIQLLPLLCVTHLFIFYPFFFAFFYCYLLRRISISHTLFSLHCMHINLYLFLCWTFARLISSATARIKFEANKIYCAAF